jgi:hypothetical protein
MFWDINSNDPYQLESSWWQNITFSKTGLETPRAVIICKIKAEYQQKWDHFSWRTGYLMVLY